MGCTSSKQTRTTSIDDLTKKDGGAPSNAGDKKNGQVMVNEKPILRETAKQNTSEAPDSSKAIQIPGAHKSFLAPDGIPFIDEDVEDENDTGTTRVVVAKATDVNKNTVPNSPGGAKPPVVVTPPTIVVAGASPQEEEERKRAVEAELLRRELDITTSKQNAPGAGGDVNEEQVAMVTTTHTTHSEPSESPRPITEEEQAKAAVKIQAGIRGYRDRQKVKAIRAAKEHPDNGPDTAHSGASHVDQELNHSSEEDYKARQQVNTMKEYGDNGATTVVCNEHSTETHTESHLQPGEQQLPADHPPPSPEMERAAIKIQASYKGYKTRKELSRSPHSDE